jgi:hypothetical protein
VRLSFPLPRAGARGSRPPQQGPGSRPRKRARGMARRSALPFSYVRTFVLRRCGASRRAITASFRLPARAHRAFARLLAPSARALVPGGRGSAPSERRLAKPARGRRPCPTSGSPLEAPLDGQGGKDYMHSVGSLSTRPGEFFPRFPPGEIAFFSSWSDSFISCLLWGRCTAVAFA